VIVLDSSVAVAALTGQPAAREAVAAQRLVAPHLIDVEVAQALRGLVIGGKISTADAGRVLELWERLAIDRVAIAPLLRRIWELRENLTAYDAAFVAAAEAHGVALLTADRRLAAAAGPRCAIQLIPL
jgi:predicted nucleic acid-binding protein